jgi:putative ABC transport system substrate-binding protein
MASVCLPDMPRRAFMAAIASALLAAPLAAEAQPPARIPTVGLLLPTTPAGSAHLVEAFRQGLRELGDVEGNTFTLLLRYAEGRSERLPELARDLVSLKVDVIVTSTDVAIAAVKRETRTIPTVMAVSGDPVGTGFVASLARPGGNVTGLSGVSPELSGKRLELLKQVVPGLARVAFLWNPDLRSAVLDYKETEATASSLHLELQSVEISAAGDVGRAFSVLTGQRAQALIVAPGSAVMLSNRAEILALTLKTRLPAMFPVKEWVVEGGLMSYGPSLPAMYRRAATYVDKILKGAKPADLPVERPTKFELAINLKTAKALGLTIPPSLLQRADQVIE